MNTYGHPHPIPFFEQAIGTAQMGPLGNSPLPVALVDMPISAASYLYYKAQEIQKTVVWTPLEEGPGTRVDYTGADGWNEETGQFTTTSSIQVLDPLYVQYSAQSPVPDQEKRDEIRGYALSSAQLDPWPGKWMGIRAYAENLSGPYGVQQSEVANTMRYDLAPIPFESAQVEFTEANSTALLAWKTRLEDWLASEEEKVPPNEGLIADIERQQEAQLLIETQVGEQQAEVISWLAQVRTDFEEMFGYTETELDRLCRNSLAIEQEAFARWIAAEEKLEAYAATQGNLWRLRIPFRNWVTFELQRTFAGWYRTSNPLAPADNFNYGLAGAFQPALASADVPALCSAQLVFRFETLPPVLSEGDLKNAGTAACATIFETFSEEYPYPDTLQGGMGDPLSTEQIQSIARVAIGPRLIGTSPEMCSASRLKGDLPNTDPLLGILSCSLLSGVYSLSDPPVYFYINFQDIFDLQTGAPKELDLASVLPFEGSKAWAFQSPYATYQEGPPESADVSPLHELWQAIGLAYAEFNMGTALGPGVPVGTFRIATPGNVTIYQTPLYAAENTVLGLSITLQVITERT